MRDENPWMQSCEVNAGGFPQNDTKGFAFKINVLSYDAQSN